MIVTEFARGVGLLGRGWAMVVRRPRLFRLGMVPPLVSSVVTLALLVVLGIWADDLVTWLTPFLDTWPAGLARLTRLVGTAMLFGAALLIMVVAFSNITLAIGAPWYDRIAASVERELGQPPEQAAGISTVRGVGQAVWLVGVSTVVTVLLFLTGLLPLVGLVVPVVSALFGGWMICLELVGSTLERRGIVRLKGRGDVLRRRRWLTFGFGVPVFLLLSIPFVSVVAFPAATAGGVLLARAALGESVRPRPSAD